MWGIQRLAVRAERWGPVITSQLASNAFGRVVPGGVAASGAVQYSMLVRAGVPAAATASGLTASSLLLFGTLLALPILAAPAIIGGAGVDPHLTKAALAGAVLFVLMVSVGAACAIWDGPLLVAGRAAQAVMNRVRRKHEPITGLPERLLRERDIILRVLGRQWWEALLLASGRWVLDYLTLIAALYAAGCHAARVARPARLLRRAAARHAAAHPRRARVRRGRAHRYARPGRRGRRRRRGRDARLPPRLVLATASGWRRGSVRPPAPVRRRGGRAAACGHAVIGARPRLALGRLGRRPGRALRGRVLGRGILLPPRVDRADGGAHDQVLLEVLGVVDVR